MTIKDLNPEIVWRNFYALTQIPRPSKKEGKAVEYLYGFGKSLGLETIKDETGNIIIRKPATPGMEDRKGVILQGHIDMVPQKNADTGTGFAQTVQHSGPTTGLGLLSHFLYSSPKI